MGRQARKELVPDHTLQRSINISRVTLHGLLLRQQWWHLRLWWLSYHRFRLLNYLLWKQHVIYNHWPLDLQIQAKWPQWMAWECLLGLQEKCRWSLGAPPAFLVACLATACLSEQRLGLQLSFTDAHLIGASHLADRHLGAGLYNWSVFHRLLLSVHFEAHDTIRSSRQLKSRQG